MLYARSLYPSPKAIMSCGVRLSFASRRSSDWALSMPFGTSSTKNGAERYTSIRLPTISYNSFFHMFYTVLLSFAVNSFHRPAYYLLYYSTILQFHHNTFLYSKNRQHQKDYTSFRTACLLHVINKTAILFTYYKYKFQHYICFQNYRKYRIRHFP